MFPSPIYGVSFKQIEEKEKIVKELLGFRPLYTGLVSNIVNVIKKIDWFVNSFRPLYTGLVSN